MCKIKKICIFLQNRQKLCTIWCDCSYHYTTHSISKLLFSHIKALIFATKLNTIHLFIIIFLSSSLSLLPFFKPPNPLPQINYHHHALCLSLFSLSSTYNHHHGTTKPQPHHDNLKLNQKTSNQQKKKKKEKTTTTTTIKPTPATNHTDTPHQQPTQIL